MTERFGGACHEFAKVDVAKLVLWISNIDLADWPQQNKPGESIRPAMACDPEWFGFKAITDPIVNQLMQQFPNCIADTRMLSVVLPGDNIPPHVDPQAKNWRCRVHVPLLTNPYSKFIVGGYSRNLRPGYAYMVNTEVEHSVLNDGDTPRIHFMFDVRLPC